MQYFVEKNSIVRRIWGKSDTILFIFAGAAAEFALNKAVDWLYFTGKLPKDPIGRMFSTVDYARKIVFAPLDEANSAIETLRKIHTSVEKSRGNAIPDWAYRDVLFMLIYYSIASFEMLERRLSLEEKEEVYQVFYRLAAGLGLKTLPLSYTEWLPVREDHLLKDLEKSSCTTDLFMQYKKHLGTMRYQLLLQAQILVVPGRVKSLLHFNDISLLTPAVSLYRISRFINMDRFLKNFLLPAEYKDRINELDL